MCELADHGKPAGFCHISELEGFEVWSWTSGSVLTRLLEIMAADSKIIFQFRKQLFSC